MKKIKFLLLYFVIIVIMLCGCEGKHINEFVKNGNDTFYYDENGKKIIDKIVEIDGNKFCFDKDGKMFKGLYESGEDIYYFDDENGQMLKETEKQIDENTYFFDEEGKGEKYENIWSKKYFVDNFGDKTNESYITNIPFKGTFSNSATDKSECLFQFLISKKSGVCLGIYEYGNQLLKGKDDEYEVTIRRKNKKNGEITDHKYLGVLHSDRIKLYDETFLDGLEIDMALEAPKIEFFSLRVFPSYNYDFKCYIKEKKDYGVPSTYNFDIKTGNLKFVFEDSRKEILNEDVFNKNNK